MTSPSIPDMRDASHASHPEAAPASRPRRFSMIRDFSLADFITLGNGFSGTGAVLLSMKYLDTQDAKLLWFAFALLPFAAFFDYVDGRVARWRQHHTPLGAQLDSLADLISFGVAPAVLAFAVGMRGGWDGLFLVYFVGCGLSRLARYNVTSVALADEKGKVPYFEGLPIPSSMLLVAMLAVLLWQGKTHGALPFGSLHVGPFEFHPLVLAYFVSGSAMISKTLRIPKP